MVFLSVEKRLGKVREKKRKMKAYSPLHVPTVLIRPGGEVCGADGGGCREGEEEGLDGGGEHGGRERYGMINE